MAGDDRSIQEFFSTASAQAEQLLRTELRLAKAEAVANVTSAGRAMALVASGGAVGISAMVVLLLAVSAWLRDLGMSEPVAHLIVAVLGLAVSGGLAWAGVSKLGSHTLAPTRTIEQVSEDAATLKDKLK